MTRAAKAVCYGEMLLRLSAPHRENLFQSGLLDAEFVGAEANVAVALARLGLPAALATVLPEGTMGNAAMAAVRAAGVNTAHVVRAPGRMGLYFLTPGSGLRAPSVIYDRAGSAFANSRPDDIDWQAALADAGHLHLSGVTPALHEDAQALSLAAMAAAREAGLSVSFDGNFRASLWHAWCRNPAPILARHVASTDLFFGNWRDISLLLGRDFAGETAQSRREAALAALAHFPRLQLIASMKRTVIHAGRHLLSARIDTREGCAETPEIELEGIVDRIGTGDAFVAGVLAHRDADPLFAAQAGLSLAALNHFTPGDMSHVTAAELAEFMARGGGDVRR